MGLLFLAFTLIPLVELYLLVRLSDVMGFWSTIALVLLTGAIGARLARAEGLRVLRRFQESVAVGRVPEDGAVSAVLVLIGGILLVTPGVLTDACGLLLLIPATRRRLIRWVSKRIEAGMRSGHVQVIRRVEVRRPEPFVVRTMDSHAAQPRVIDVEARVIDSKPTGEH